MTYKSSVQCTPKRDVNPDPHDSLSTTTAITLHAKREHDGGTAPELRQLAMVLGAPQPEFSPARREINSRTPLVIFGPPQRRRERHR